MKLLKKAAAASLALTAAAFLTGCGGFSASPSISPASFFLPGFVGAEREDAGAPRPEPSSDEVRPGLHVASAR